MKEMKRNCNKGGNLSAPKSGKKIWRSEEMIIYLSRRSLLHGFFSLPRPITP